MVVEIKKTEDGFLDFPSMVKEAMLKGDKFALMTFRQIMSRIMEFKTQEVKEGQSRPVYDLAAEKKLLETVQKELQKDVEIYLNINTAKSIANASESQNQLNVVNELLPKPASDDEINEGIADWIVKYGPITPKDMKMVINHVVAGHPNARKSDIARIVKSNIKK